MASCTPRIAFIAVSTFLLVGLGASTRMEVSPNGFNKQIHDKLNISCIVDGPLANAQDVIGIQIERPNGKPIASIDAKHNLVMGLGIKSNVKAEGNIDNQSGRSYLLITISNPGVGDTGRYECSMFYTDPELEFTEGRADVNVTMNNEDIESIVTYLLGRISDLEREVQEKGNDNPNCKCDGSEVSREVQLQIEQQRSKILQLEKSVNQCVDGDRGVEDLQETVININRTILQQTSNMQQQHFHITQLQTKVEQNTQNDRENKEDLSDLQDIVAKFNQTLHQQKDHGSAVDVSDLKKTVAALNTTFNLLQTTNHVDKYPTPCAFSVARQSQYKLEENKIVLFSNPVTNVGNHFDTKTGTFTAPQDGLYVFHLVVMTGLNGQLFLDMRINGKDDIASLFVDEKDKTTLQGSVSSVVSLHTGDTVSVYVSRVSRMYFLVGEHYSVFSGFLLQPL